MASNNSHKMASRTLVISNVEENAISLNDRRRYWCVAALAGLGVAGGIFMLVVLPALLLNAQLGETDRRAQPTLLLDDILDQRYSARWFNGSWLSDTEFIFKDEKGHLLMHNIELQTSVFIVSNDSMIPDQQCSYTLSPDRKYVLVGFNFTRRFRHLLGTRFSIIDLEAQTSAPLHNTLGLPDPGFLQVAVWAPQGSALAYVYRNNLYYRSAANDVTDYNVTTTGVRGIVYHGATDWIYNDAVFGTHQAVWFSDNGTRLAYASFNDTDVRSETISWYGAPMSAASQYTTPVYYKYPKPGTSNPVVTLSVVDIENVLQKSNDTLRFDIPSPQNLSDPILTAVTWAGDEDIVSVWTNRVSTQGWIVICNCVTFECREVWKSEESEGWLGMFVAPRFSSDLSRMLIVLPQDQDDDVGSFRHLTMIDSVNGSAVAMTKGHITVTDILAWDEGTSLIYMGGVPANDSAQSHVYVIPDDVTRAPHTPHCITCGWLTAHSGVECTYNVAYYSYNASYYMHFCMGPGVPEITFYTKDHELVSIWDTNDHVRALLEGKAQPRTLRLQVAVPGGFTANVKLWLPPRMDSNTKYPLLVDVYAGPDFNQIYDRFEIDWRVYLTTNLSIVYAAIDGRGSAMRGDRFMFATHRKLGTVEIQDQISVTQHLLSEYPFLDARRTAIWGWSYGGYSTLKVLENDTAGVFKCGIAVAPVTDWTYYTSIYTERMLGLPTADDNLSGYKEANVNDKLENLRHKKLLLIHGTFDNIALFQNAMVFSRAMEERNILFQQQSYTDEDHALAGVSHHLHYTMINFLNQCFQHDE